MGTLFPFSDFWSFGADDSCAAVASAALKGDLEILNDICNSCVLSVHHSVALFRRSQVQFLEWLLWGDAAREVLCW